MKVNRPFAPDGGHPPVWTAVRLLAFVIVLLIVAGCVALATPPSGSPPTAVPEANPLACPVVEPESLIPYIARFQSNPDKSKGGYFEFTAGPDSTAGTRAKTNIRLRIPSGGNSARLQAIELCPMTDGKACDGRSDLTGAEAEAIQALAPDAIELVRFEIVDSEISGKMGDVGEVRAASIQRTFDSPIELWARFGKEKLKSVGSLLANDAPRTGYWSCKAGSFAWTEFTTDKHNLRVVIERVDQVSLVLIAVPGVEVSDKNQENGVVAVPIGMTEEEAAKGVETVLPQIASSSTGEQIVTVEIGDSANFSIRKLIEALQAMGTLKEEGQEDPLSFKMFAVVNVSNWNDPGLSME